jgi:tetratricopeptide (TPR) repeat protein
LDDAAEVVEFAGRNVPEEDAFVQADLLLAQALVAAEQGDRAKTLKSYLDAIVMLEEQHLPINVGEARIALGRALSRFGDIAAARQQFELARKDFEQMGAVGILAPIDLELERITSGGSRAASARST